MEKYIKFKQNHNENDIFYAIKGCNKSVEDTNNNRPRRLEEYIFHK